MNDTKTTNSDTDVSESNSWIVLCECEESVKPVNEKLGDCETSASETFPDLVIVENNELVESLPESKSIDKKITDDAPDQNENVSDQEIVHDDGDEKPKNKTHSKCKSKRKRRGKNKSNEIGSLFIIGTVLAITGASLLCLITPKNVNVSPSSVSQLQTNCSKLGIVNDISLPLKATVSKCGSKLNIQDKEGSLQTYLKNQGFMPNATDPLDVEKCFGPLTYQQFEQKIETFNKQYGKPTSPSIQSDLEQKEIKKPLSVPPASYKANTKTAKTGGFTPVESGKIPKNFATSEPSTSKTQTQKEDQTLLQYKIVCNVLQDLALLRLTQVFAKQLADKAAKRRKKVAAKSDAKKKTVKRSEPFAKIKKQTSSSTALMLWDELPFNHEIPSKHIMTDIMEEEDLRKVGSKMSLTDIASKTSKMVIMEKHHKKQLDYLEKLKQEHNNRMAYLKGIRERQQKSIQALIQERKQDLKKLNHYTEQQQHIMEGKRRLLEINDYYRKLKNGLASRSPSDSNHQENNKDRLTMDGDVDAEADCDGEVEAVENGDGDHENDFLENGRDDQAESPESSHSRNEKELEEIMDVETNVQNCIRHALSVVTVPASQRGSSPPSLAATAPSNDEWKNQTHTLLSPKVNNTPY